MVFPKNSWYMAAFSADIGKTPLVRTVAGERLVLFRSEKGEVGILADRCAHRLYPLSRGRVVGEALRCGYHGASFTVDGRCVHIPGQDTIPNGSRVRAYPVIERHGMVWVWTGAPDNATDGSEVIGQYDYHRDSDWDSREGQMLSIACSYELMNDNIFDLSHAEFIHGSTLRSEGFLANRRGEADVPPGENTFEAQVKPNEIVYTASVLNGRIPPAFEEGYKRVYGLPEDGRLNFVMDVYFRPPSFWLAIPVVSVPGASDGRTVQHNAIIITTPETDYSCHYFHRVSKKYRPGQRPDTQFWYDQLEIAFAEDRDACEAQQANMGPSDLYDHPMVAFNGDRLSFVARKMIRARVEAERTAAALVTTP